MLCSGAGLWLVLPAGTWMDKLILGLRLCFVISVQAALHSFEFERETEVKKYDCSPFSDDGEGVSRLFLAGLTHPSFINILILIYYLPYSCLLI